MSRPVTSALASLLALSAVSGAAAAQDPPEPVSAIYVSMCPEPVVAGQCRDAIGQRLDTELTALSPDGDERRVLTDNRAYEHRPVWSPDAERVAFSLGRRGWSCDTNQGLRTMAAAGGDVDVLTRRSFGCDHATDWSPDGRRILFEHECSLCFEVWWVSADDEHDQRLSTEGDRNDPDAYALDGHWVDGGSAVVFGKNDYARDVHGISSASGRTRRACGGSRLACS